jgi:hypothetical protein
MTKAITFAAAIVLALTTWLAAERKQHSTTAVYMVTSFDFTTYPACRSSQGTNCIQGVRFYDADSGQRLADAPVSAQMTGRREISAIARVGSLPRGVYAVTVYLDPSGQAKEGRPGEISRSRDAVQ